jgi:hypothetical protein
MDTAEPVFEDLIVEQAGRHLEMLPSFEGIAIDRLDYSEFFNYNADDGVSWVPINSSGAHGSALDVFGPARALRLSYRHTFNRLHEVLHAEGRTTQPGSSAAKKKIMYNNCNSLCRLDEMRSFDGTFSEGASLNAVAWTGLKQPTILWTYDLSPDTAALDSYFQQHLLMNVYPMAPMPKNDHSITPGSPVVEAAYMAYAPLFNAMHGARWLLSTRPVHLDADAGAVANVFTLPRSLTAAEGATAWPDLLVNIMLGATSTTTTLTLSLGPAARAYGWPRISGGLVSTLHPGSTVWSKPVAVTEVGQNLTATIVLVRGCATVKVTCRLVE